MTKTKRQWTARVFYIAIAEDKTESICSSLEKAAAWLAVKDPQFAAAGVNNTHSKTTPDGTQTWIVRHIAK